MKVEMINNYPVKIWTDQVEASAMRQIENLTSLPFLFHHLAIMPDVHTGKGMPIGGVLACKDAVIPNAVGRRHRMWHVCRKNQLEGKRTSHDSATKRNHERHQATHPARNGPSL